MEGTRRVAGQPGVVNMADQEQTPEFVNQPFEVVEQPFIPPPPSVTSQSQDPTLEGQIPSPSSQSEEKLVPDDTLFISEMLLNSVPAVFIPAMPARSQDQVEGFNNALVKYCERKGINIFDYLFDEFELVIVVAGLLGSYRRDYIEIKKGKSTEDEKLNLDHTHAQEVAKAAEILSPEVQQSETLNNEEN